MDRRTVIEGPYGSKTTIGIMPVGARVIVEAMSEENMSDGGIVIPDQSQEKPQLGFVVAIGEGRLLPNGEFRAPCQFQLGDVVMYGRYAGRKITKKFKVANPKLGQVVPVLAGEEEPPVPTLYHEFAAVMSDGIATDKCQCGLHVRDRAHVPAEIMVERSFSLIREEEIDGLELDETMRNMPCDRSAEPEPPTKEEPLETLDGMVPSGN